MMSKDTNYRVLSPEQTEKILAAFVKAHGYHPSPKEAMRWAKSAEGRAALGVSMFYEEAPTTPHAHNNEAGGVGRQQ